MGNQKPNRQEPSLSAGGDLSLRQIFDHHTAIMLLIEPESGRVLDANQAALNFYGYPKSKLCSLSLAEINGLSAEQLASERQKASNEGRNYVVLKHRLANGQERTVEELSSTITWQHKPALFVIIHDISERVSYPASELNLVLQEEVRQREFALEDLRIHKVELEMQNDELRKTQLELENARARYFDLYDLAPVGYCTISEKGLILEANLTAANLLGHTRAGLLKKSFSRFISKEHQFRYYLHRKKLFETGKAQVFDAQMVNADGSLAFWGHLDTSLAQDPHGDAVARVMISDISERKRAENKLVESEALFRDLADTAPVLIWQSGTDMLCNYFNQHWLNFTGRSLQQEMGNGWAEGVHPDDYQSCLATYQAAFKAQREFEVEYRLRRYDGEYRWLQDRGVPRFSSGHQFIGYIGSCVDITERKNTLELIQKSEERLREVLENSLDVSYKRDFKSKAYEYMSPVIASIAGYTLEEMESLPFETVLNLIHPDDQKEVERVLAEAALKPQQRAHQVDYRFRHKDGQFRWFRDHFTMVFDPQGQPLALIGSVSDISQARRAEQDLLEANWQMQSIIEGTHAGTWVWNIQTGETIFNEEWAQIAGYTLAELSPSSIQTWIRMAHPDDLKYSDELLQRHFAGELPNYDCELRMKHKDGDWVWVHDRGRLITRTPDGKPLMMFGIHTDITGRKVAEERVMKLNAELEKLAMTDYLTKIYNRRYFMQRAKEEFNREARNNQPLALLMMDLDEFKKINDTYGHALGDSVLQQVAAVLSSNLREIDILGRIGGEEFAVLLPNTAQEDAVVLAERMRQAIEDTPIDIAGRAAQVTISIGVAGYTGEMSSVSVLLKNADIAMYQAKHSGRNCVRVFQDLS